MTGSNGDWSFSAEFPPATYSWSQQICCDCDGGSYWTYAYVYGNPGGSFTLSGPDDQIFTGYFQHPGTFAVGEASGLAGYGTCHGILFTLGLGINFAGEWSNGTKDVGTLSFYGTVLLSPVEQVENWRGWLWYRHSDLFPQMRQKLPVSTDCFPKREFLSL